jgi:hypothetical protein
LSRTGLGLKLDGGNIVVTERIKGNNTDEKDKAVVEFYRRGGA